MGSETCICDYTRDNDYENGKLIRNPACRAHPTPAPGPLDFEKAKRDAKQYDYHIQSDVRAALTAQALAYGARCAAAERARSAAESAAWSAARSAELRWQGERLWLYFTGAL